MKQLNARFIAFALAVGILLPLLAGCGKSEKAMETPDGTSPRQARDAKKGVGQ